MIVPSASAKGAPSTTTTTYRPTEAAIVPPAPAKGAPSTTTTGHGPPPSDDRAASPRKGGPEHNHHQTWLAKSRG